MKLIFDNYTIVFFYNIDTTKSDGFELTLSEQDVAAIGFLKKYDIGLTKLK